MPLIEVLPNSTATATPGWAYVLDTGYDPSKAPIGASGQRKRKNAPVAAAAELSVRQQNKIAKHLDELDRDNHKAVQIELPSKSKDVTARGEQMMMMMMMVIMMMVKIKRTVHVLTSGIDRIARQNDAWS